MGLIRKFINVIKEKYRRCTMCEKHKNNMLPIEGFCPNMKYENMYSTASGIIFIKCPPCKGTGIIWEDEIYN